MLHLRNGARLEGDEELVFRAVDDEQAAGDGLYAAEPRTGLRSTWGDDAPLACFVNSEPAAILLWEYPDAALQVVAVRRDRDAPGFADDSRALFDWWTTAVRSEVT